MRTGYFAIVIIVVFVLSICLSCAGDRVSELAEGTGDISKIAPEDIGESFICMDDGREVSLEYEKFPITWNSIQANYIHIPICFMTDMPPADKSRSRLATARRLSSVSVIIPPRRLR